MEQIHFICITNVCNQRQKQMMLFFNLFHRMYLLIKHPLSNIYGYNLKNTWTIFDEETFFSNIFWYVKPTCSYFYCTFLNQLFCARELILVYVLKGFPDSCFTAVFINVFSKILKIVYIAFLQLLIRKFYALKMLHKCWNYHCVERSHFSK